jgi:hypothetical protein
MARLDFLRPAIDPWAGKAGPPPAVVASSKRLATSRSSASEPLFCILDPAVADILDCFAIVEIGGTEFGERGDDPVAAIAYVRIGEIDHRKAALVQVGCDLPLDVRQIQRVDKSYK